MPTKITALFLTTLVFYSGLFGEEKGSPTIRMAIRHIEGGGIGYNQGYTTLEGFFSPVISSDNIWALFLDLRGHLFNDGKPAVNAGIGARYLAGSRIWGGSVYYDYRKTHRHPYHQIGAGFESLGKVWDFRVNGYLPVGKTRSSLWHSRFDHFDGHFALLSSKMEFALKGVDAEAAAHIKIKEKKVTASAGPYYLAGHGKHALGAKARVELALSPHVKLEGFTSYDSLFHLKGQGQFSLEIPFGGKRKAATPSLSTRMFQAVSRFEIIPLKRKRKVTKAIDPSTGNPYFFWFVDNTSHSQGTFESPFSTLTAAQNASQSGDVIYVFPGDGTSTGMDLGLTLKNSQRLLGAGITHFLPTTRGTIVIPPLASGLPSVTAPTGSSVINIASNNVISGFQISSDAGGVANGSYCIGSTLGLAVNLSIFQSILTANNGAMGIVPMAPSGQITITGNTIQSLDQQGTFGIFISQVSGEGIYNIGNNSIVNLQNNTSFFQGIPTGTAIVLIARNQSEASAFLFGNQITDCITHGIDQLSSDTSTFSILAQNNRIDGQVLITEVGIFLFSASNAITNALLLKNEAKECNFGIIAQLEDNSIMNGFIQHHNFLTTAPLGSGMVLATNRNTPGGSARAFFNITSNEISHFGDAQGIAIQTGGTSSILNASIENNSLHDMGKAGLFVMGLGSSKTILHVKNNQIFNNNGGIEAEPNENSSLNVTLEGNTITGNNGAGFFSKPNDNGSAQYTLIFNRFMNNNLLNLNSGSAVTIITQDSSNGCLRLIGNQSTLEATQPDYFLENTGAGQFNVEPLIGNIGSINQIGTIPVPSGACGP